MVKQWYIIHTYSGFEDRVKKTLEQRIVPLADLLVDGVTPSSVEDRLASLHRRYADNPDFLTLVDRASKRAASLVAELEELTGRSVEDLARSAGPMLPSPHPR